MAKIGYGLGFDESEIEMLRKNKMDGGAEGDMFRGLMQLSDRGELGTGKQKNLGLDIDDPRHMEVVEALGQKAGRQSQQIPIRERNTRDAEGDIVGYRTDPGGSSGIKGSDRGLFKNQRDIDRQLRRAGRVSGSEIPMSAVVKGIAVAGLAAMTGGTMGPLLAGAIAPTLGVASGGLAAGALGGASAGLIGGATAGAAGSALGGFEGGIYGTLKNIGMGGAMGAAGGGIIGGTAGAFGGASSAGGLAGPYAGLGRATAQGLGISAGAAGTAGGGMIQTAATLPTGQGGMSANAAQMSMLGGMGYDSPAQALAQSGVSAGGASAGGMTSRSGVGGQENEASFMNRVGAEIDKFGPSAKIAGRGIQSAMQDASARGEAMGGVLQEAQAAGIELQSQSAQANAAGLASRIQQKNSIFENNPFYDPIEDFDSAQTGVF
jgi:hypothetical protein